MVPTLIGVTIANLSHTDTVSLRSVSVVRSYLKNRLVSFFVLIKIFSRLSVINWVTSHGTFLRWVMPLNSRRGHRGQDNLLLS